MSGLSSSGPVVVAPGVGAEGDRATRWAAHYAQVTAHELVRLGDQEAEGSKELVDLISAAAPRPALAVVAASLLHGHAHGAGGVRAVAERLGCPVVVFPAVDRPAAAVPREVVAGMDGTPASRAVAEFGFACADALGLELVLLHAVQDRVSRGSSVLGLLESGHEAGISVAEEVDIAEAIAGLPESYPDVLHRSHHRSTDAASALADASQDAELLVIGQRPHPALRTAVGHSVTAALLPQARCPVAIVPVRRPVSDRPDDRPAHGGGG